MTKLPTQMNKTTRYSDSLLELILKLNVADAGADADADGSFCGLTHV